jgi:hypothetical protein
MALSWHEKDYNDMVEEMEDYIRKELHLQTFDAHAVVGHLVNIMIDHGAVDPT